MKRMGYTIAIILVMITVFIFAKSSYAPPLPIENLSAKEVIEKLEESNRKIVEIAVEDGAGLFFEKDGERLVATTQMWSGKYVLIKVQRKFKN